MLSIEAVDSFYGKYHALKQVSLKVEKGEIVSIIGANGAGKTTLLKTICGLISARGGAVFLEGTDITRFPVEKIFSLGVCMVPEGREIFSDLSVRENLEVGAYCRFRKGERAEILQDMEKLFDIFPVLKDRIRQKAGTLSGGEQQMLAIARGIISRPKLLLLDEPSLGLAPLMVELIFDVIARLRQSGITILLAEQNCHLALTLADRGYVMQTGSVITGDSSENLLKNEQVSSLYLGRRARII